MHSKDSLLAKKSFFQNRNVRFVTFLIFFFIIGLARVNSQSTQEFKMGTDTLITYSDVPGFTASDKYTIKVRSAATANQWVDVFALFTYNRAEELKDPLDPTKGMFYKLLRYAYQLSTADWSHTYGNIEMSKNTEVEVEIAYKGNFQFNGQPITKATAHPAHKVSKQPEIKDGKIYFSINKPGQVYIDINGQMEDYNFAINALGKSTEKPYGIPLHAVSLFANPVIKKPTLNNPRTYYVQPGADTAITRNVDPALFDTFYFMPGVHNIGINFKLYPNKTYYIPGDAIVTGSMNNIGMKVIDNVRAGENIKIYGYGTITQLGIHHPGYMVPPPADDRTVKPIFISDAYNVDISGISFMDACYHTATIFAWDGRPDKTSKTSFYRWVKCITWRTNGDGLGGDLTEDCFLRTTDDANYLHGEFKRCIFWRDIHAAGVHIALVKSAPILYEDCDVLYLRDRDAVGYTGSMFMARGLGGPGQQTINAVVRNFRCHDKLANSPFFSLNVIAGKDVNGNIIYGPSYKGLTFQNIDIASHNIMNILEGSAASPYDGGIVFDNVTIKGTLLTQDNFSTYFKTNEFTKNIIFKNSTNYNLTITNPNNGTISSGSELTSFVDGTKITLRALPKPGYEFVSWSGDASGTTNPTTITMTKNMSVSAIFIKQTKYTFETPGSGSWTVPKGVTSISLKAWGAGGAGGSAKTGVVTVNSQAKAGGGAGGSFAGTTLSVTPGQVINYTIGAGGNGSAAGFVHQSYSEDGGNTEATLNSQTIVLAQGGKGGQSVDVVNMSSYGTGGVATTTGNTGDVIFYGGNGGSAGAGSGGGGGSAGAEGAGGNGGAKVAGSAGLGGGAMGGLGTNDNPIMPYAGFFPGGGGGGAVVRNYPEPAQNNVHRTGAKGADGKLEISVNTETSIATNYLKNGISVYPNPASDKLHFDANGLIVNKVELYSLTGKLVFSTIDALNNGSIDLAGLNTGIYFVKAYTSNGVSTAKFIIK